MVEWFDTSLYGWADTPNAAWSNVLYIDLTLYQVWSDINYAYAVTSEGLDVYDINTEDKVAYVTVSGGFTTIWGNDTTIYLGSTSGIKYFYKEAILGDNIAPIDLIGILESFIYYAPLSNNVKYIHGYEEVLAIVTSVGIDIVDNSLNGFKSSLSNSRVNKCFATSTKELYYTTTSGVFKIDSWLHDWIEPDSSFILNNIEVNDIFVTTGTAVSGINNTLFVATSSGVFLYDEDSTQEDYYLSELAGSSKIITGVWTDEFAAQDFGKMYIISSGPGAAFSVFDLKLKILWDRYTKIEIGRSGDTLLAEDMVDVVTTKGN